MERPILKKNKTSKSESGSSKGNFIKKFKFTSKEKRVWMIVLAVLLSLSLIVAIYAIGYKYGYKQGKKDSSVRRASGGLNNSNPSARSFLRTANGKIEKINDKDITVKTLRGESQKIMIDDKTKITKRAKELKVSDLKAGDSVVVFLNGEKESDQVASRIIVREPVKTNN